MIEPKTWTDNEILDLMLEEIREYKLDQIKRQEPIDYRNMMECVLGVLKDQNLIQDTP